MLKSSSKELLFKYFLLSLCEKLTPVAFHCSMAVRKGWGRRQSWRKHQREVQIHNRHLDLMHCLSAQAFCLFIAGTVLCSLHPSFLPSPGCTKMQAFRGKGKSRGVGFWEKSWGGAWGAWGRVSEKWWFHLGLLWDFLALGYDWV